MNRSDVAEMLESTLGFLETEGRQLLPAEAVESLSDRTEDLLEKAREDGELLYVGIMGGTGVGKSTLINALAKERISSPSDRRPFTDKAVVYRHRDVRRGLSDLSHLIREPDAIHGADAVKHLVLLDLPDFDSVEPANRRTVLALMPRLDCIVWVVSPEKYADEAFYQLVGATAMSRENFTFVLNKADLLSRQAPGTDSALEAIMGDLVLRLRRAGRIDNPLVFAISAEGEIHGNSEDERLSDEFERFRSLLMRRREAKDIASVKTANLAEEAKLIIQGVGNAVRPGEKAELVTSLKRIDEASEREVGRPDRMTEELTTLPASVLCRAFLDADRSIGPVKTAMRLHEIFRSRVYGNPANVDAGRAFRSVTDHMLRDWEKDLRAEAGRPDRMIEELTTLPASVLCRAFLDADRSIGPVKTAMRLHEIFRSR
ncbi:MAG: GTPase, partial [Pseudomonadota bacterium]